MLFGDPPKPYKINGKLPQEIKHVLEREERKKVQDTINQLEKERKIYQKKVYEQKAEVIADVKRTRRCRKEIKEELSYAVKVTNMVRKSVLKQQLECEHHKYEAELNAMGKAFCLDRL